MDGSPTNPGSRKVRIVQTLVRVAYLFSFALFLLGMFLFQSKGKDFLPLIYLSLFTWLFSGAAMVTLNAFGVLRFSLQMIFFGTVGTAFGISATKVLPGTWKALGIAFLIGLFVWAIHDVLKTNFRISDQKLEKKLLAAHKELLLNAELKNDGK